MTNWAYKEGSLGYKTWIRSYRQSIETGFRQQVVLLAHIEELRLYDDGRIEINRNFPVISIPLGQLVDAELADAITIHTKLSGLIETRVNALLNPPPEPPPEPEPEVPQS